MDLNDIRDNYMFYDLDWFAWDASSRMYIHVASGGGKIPEKILGLIISDNHDSSYEKILNRIYSSDIPQKIELSLDGLGEYCNNNNNYVSVNSEFYDKMINKPETKERYLASFVLMALRGFYSFDKTDLNNSDDPMYHLVAWPKNGSKDRDILSCREIPHLNLGTALKDIHDKEKAKTLYFREYDLVEMINNYSDEENV